MQGITNVKVVEVIRTETVIGTGTKEDPVRTVVQYWDKSGKSIRLQNYLEEDIRVKASS